MADPVAPPAKLTQAQLTAMFTARDEAMRVHFSDILTSYSVAHDPETITYADALGAVILNYQNLLDAEPIVYDEEVDYVPADNGGKSYWIYLYDLVATIPP